jgi:hypothetical protein
MHATRGFEESEELIPEVFLRDLRFAARGAEHAEVERLLRVCESSCGKGAFLAEALSWAARAYFKKGHLQHAALRAQETYTLAASLVDGGETLESVAGVENPLATALGAAIEVTAQLAVAEGRSADAIAHLQEMEERYRGLPIHTRIRKNLLQLTLQGQPAPALDMTPLPKTEQGEFVLGNGRILLFFWAHWCSDSRTQSRTLGLILAKPEFADIRLIAPTRRFGYVSKGTAAEEAEEITHIREVLSVDYPLLREKVPIPYGTGNFETYGASTFPTLVLIDHEGVVRLYHPGVMKLDALEAALGAAA